MTTDPRYDVLVRDLQALGAASPPPEAQAHLVDAVLTRIAELPVPAPRPAARHRLFDALRAAFVDRRRRVAAAVAVLLAGLLLAPPVRAAVSEWFAFAGVQIRQGPAPSGTPGPREVQGSLTLEEAQGLVDFELAVPSELGPPDGVEVSDDRRILSMSWTGTPDGTVRMDTFDARLDYTFVKQAPDAYFTTVDDRFAVWFDRPHAVTLVRADGTQREVDARLAAQTLIWERLGSGMRLEGDLTRQRAVEIAESAEPLR